ncbi:SDR family NAD(P)-dependent oxidoreductase [Dyadobacter sp. LJ53]|uniref:SDR family NAD(P)-dependent oxidoreductase n=1 Tax=Dyadobacter chenwenxiniae TaxID=2906456 RepID=UPI001F449B31|nr:SDR family NAD(P)-dependent oxidoreductase [Dyadobacter chenwenxiniae]MCF0049302.1 SDR family NAD(P)-dependent oxidoreductase [Dyadobacter chenwenxiniae]
MKNDMKIALITGVSRREGIGFETAKQLGQKGFKVIISAFKLDEATPLISVLNKLGIEADAVEIDITNDSSVIAAVEKIKAEYGKLDLLINNAVFSILLTATIEDEDLSELTKEVTTNIVGTWRVTQKFIPLLRQSDHGRIVNISSSKGSFTDTEWGLRNFDESFGPIPAYSITKAAINAITVKTARELKQYGILVNAVCPGFTATYPGLEDKGARPVSDGAEGIVWAATIPDDGPTGLFFRDRKIVPW